MINNSFDGIEEVLVVPQFHYDVAYLQTEEEYYPRCWDNFQQAIALMDAHPAYRYTIEQPFLLEAFQERFPADFARLKACYDRGQLEVSGALYVIPDMNMPGGESLVRQVLWGKRWVRENFGADVQTAWIADTWGHPATVPQIMAHCGVHAYFFTRCMRPEFRHGDFLWIGLDGTEMAAHWLPGGYATLRFPEAQELANALELSQVSATEENLRALAQRLKPYLAQRTLLLCSGGDMAPPQATAPEVMRAWQAQGLPVRFGAIAEYAERLRAAKQALPCADGDFNPLFIGTQASRIKLKQANRQLENQLQTAERLHAMLRLSGYAVPPPSLESAWKALLKNQFHDIISGTLVDAAYHQAMREYETAFAAVRARMVPMDREAGGVFNPSAFERTEWVATQDGQGTAPVTVPALGWAAQPLHPPAAADSLLPRDGVLTLGNGYWRVIVGADGTLTSVTDRRSGQEFVAPGGPGWGDLVYRNDNGDLWLLDRGPLDGGSPASAFVEPQSDDPYRRSTDPLVNNNPTCQSGRAHARAFSELPGAQTVTVSGTLGFWKNRVQFETRITLDDDDPLIYFHTVVQLTGRHYRVYACFPTPWPDAVARQQIPFGATVRDNRRYAAQDWAEAVGGEGAGVRLLNAGIPGNALNHGVLSLLLFRSAAMEYKADSADAFEEGQTLTFSYAVRPFTSDDPGHADREGERLNRPLRVSAQAQSPLPAPPAFSLTPENVQVAALYGLEGGEYLLRVYECAGNSAQGRILLGNGIAGAWVSDGLETRGEPVQLQDGAIAFSLRPWQIAAWRILR